MVETVRSQIGQRGGSGQARLDVVFSALADSTRRDILRRLERGPETVMRLAGRCDMSQPAVTKHLHVLERAGLISRESRGRQRWCSLRASGMREAWRWIERYRAYWEERLDVLEEVLSKNKSAGRADLKTRGDTDGHGK